MIPCNTAAEVDVLLAFYSSVPSYRNTDPLTQDHDPWFVCDMYGFNVFDPEGQEVWLESDVPLLQQQIEDHYDSPWVQELLESHKLIFWGQAYQLDDGSWTHQDNTVGGIPYTSYSNPATARPQAAACSTRGLS